MYPLLLSELLTMGLAAMSGSSRVTVSPAAKVHRSPIFRLTSTYGFEMT